MSRKQFVLLSIVLIGTIIGLSFLWSPILWSMIIVTPLILLGVYDMIQKLDVMNIEQSLPKKLCIDL